MARADVTRLLVIVAVVEVVPGLTALGWQQVK